MTLLNITIILIAVGFFIIMVYIYKKTSQKINDLPKKIILNFLYWYVDEIHPADANNLVDEYLNKNNDDE